MIKTKNNNVWSVGELFNTVGFLYSFDWPVNKITQSEVKHSKIIF